MKITLVKQLDHSFKAAYNSDYDKIKKIKPLTEFECSIVKKRNYKFHKKYFALINLVYDNQELYNNIDDLREDLTIEAGFYTWRENIKGERIKKANSISFSNMDDIQFNDVYSKTLDVIAKYFNFDKEDINEHIEQYF